MRVDLQVIGTEATIRGWLKADRGWMVWRDDSGRRPLYRPSFVAIHVPSGRIIGVYVRPRKLYPSEMPDTSWLPAAVEPVVWHPGMSGEIRSWLTVAVGEAPGAVSTTRDGAK